MKIIDLLGLKPITQIKREFSAAEKQRVDFERLENLKRVIPYTLWYGIPAEVIFWFTDMRYYSGLKNEFFFIRVITIALVIIFGKLIQSSQSLMQAEIYVTLFGLCWSVPLNLMVYRIGDLGTPYYAGLFFVIIGVSNGFRLTQPFFILVVTLTLAPFLLLFPFMIGVTERSYFLLSALFLLGGSTIALFNRVFNEYIYHREFVARLELEHEITNRDAIIQEKSASVVKLAVSGLELRLFRKL
jgi:hypothetical protein